VTGLNWPEQHAAWRRGRNPCLTPALNSGPESATPDAHRLSHKKQHTAFPDRERSILPIPLTQ